MAANRAILGLSEGACVAPFVDRNSLHLKLYFKAYERETPR
jgi:hypothetical protein